ncbi:NAD(P)H-binding protein [Nocardia sp. NPDC020380]|uniref:NAD(P)H-binding protein n=1 Tax=Nocardia sp. NPDC020380 TaxID=3364309 RepID=UPI0037A65408
MGATGATGHALLIRLIEQGIPCRGLSRDPDRLRAMTAGAEVAYADAADTASLRVAFEGATQLFLTMVNSPAQVEHETRAIEIARECGIRHVVKLSAPAAAPDSPVGVSRWHHAIEQTLRASGLEHTLLRPYAFMQKLPLLGPQVAARGTILGAMGSAACNYIDARDIADVAAAALTRTEIAGGTYTLTGSRTYSYPELANLLSGMLGTPVRYLVLSPADFRAQLIERSGMPGWLADHITEIQQLAVANPEHPTDTVARILGRPPRSLESYVAENLDAFRAPTGAGYARPRSIRFQ